MLDRLLTYLFGRKCPKCGQRSLDSNHSHFWSRGRNHLCEQACGDAGWRCYECGYIEWDQTLEEYKRSLPSWCEATKPKDTDAN